MENYTEIYERWLKATEDNAELHEELLAVRDDPKAIEDRFYRELEFGTAGLRGVLGAGTNRMNIFVVAKATQGYSNYLLRHFENPSVAIGYDSRIHSQDFAEAAAAVFAANGIRVYLYPKLMPVPACSFAVRDLGCSGGVMITASHNPAKYNGYKVYGADGCQITSEAAKEILDEINSVDIFTGVKRGAFPTEGISYITDETVERYFAAIAKSSVLPGDLGKGVKIVYTPLNGAGISCVPECLKRRGFTDIILVEEQKNPDGNFPTCPYPNPEIREALELGLQWAEKTQSDLLLATDPDCDRVGAAIKTGDGYRLISGNEMGVLLLDFICTMRLRSGTMPKNPIAVKTIVTTPLTAAVAKHYGVTLVDVLTGFKYIGEQIGLLEKNGEEDRYILGFEESYGYLSGSFVRDKDGVNASLLICEMFAYYRSIGKTLADRLEELAVQFGCYQSKLLSFTFEGGSGFAKMQQMMCSLRENTPRAIAGIPVEAVGDYKAGTITYPDGTVEPTGLPQSDVMRFMLAGGNEVTVRPSGTEPKLKMYLTAVGTDKADALRGVAAFEEYCNGWVNA